MARLRRVDCSGPGLRRRRRGRGFEYLDGEGRRIEDPATLARIAELTIPPAWDDVWICPHPNGHIQATGTDGAGRKQYLYHQGWREARDREKFDEMIEFARSLPALRQRVAADLAGERLIRERVLACAVRLLDQGFFRVGGEDYAADNDSYGLATIRKEHVTVSRGVVTFDYPAKSGRQHIRPLVDPEVYRVLLRLRRRRSGGPELLAHRRGRRWTDVRSDDINQYVKQAAGGDFSAKDFRTWHATRLAALALAVSGPVAGTRTGRKAAKNRAVKEVAGYLGNTPAVCRSSYIDPRVFDRYDAGLTIGGAVDLEGVADLAGAASQRPLELAVVDLLTGEGSPALERVA